jgi:hypothetical protein
MKVVQIYCKECNAKGDCTDLVFGVVEAAARRQTLSESRPGRPGGLNSQQSYCSRYAAFLVADGTSTFCTCTRTPGSEGELSCGTDKAWRLSVRIVELGSTCSVVQS